MINEEVEEDEKTPFGHAEINLTHNFDYEVDNNDDIVFKKKNEMKKLQKLTAQINDLTTEIKKEISDQGNELCIFYFIY